MSYYNSFIIIIFGLLRLSEAIQLVLNNCPVLYWESCETQLIKFHLFTFNNRIIELDPFNPKLPDNFNMTIPIKIVIHGYGGLSVDTASTNVTKAYQDVGYNIILVDWENLASVPCYGAAYLNTWYVGQCVAVLIVSLIPFGIHPAILHVVGFSLGAHIAGFTGKQLKKVLGMPLHRITGLDPALPFFATLKDDWKLNYDDADFVDVIHTSAGSFGKIEPLGHVDFYVNGGAFQPFCVEAKYPAICSHIMAGLYFAESIRNNKVKFIGYECENLAIYFLGLCSFKGKAIMGENASPDIKGIFFVETSDKSPFAINYKGNMRFN